jgi:hypothetical protein
MSQDYISVLYTFLFWKENRRAGSGRAHGVGGSSSPGHRNRHRRPPLGSARGSVVVLSGLHRRRGRRLGPQCPSGLVGPGTDVAVAVGLGLLGRGQRSPAGSGVVTVEVRNGGCWRRCAAVFDARAAWQGSGRWWAGRLWASSDPGPLLPATCLPPAQAGSEGQATSVGLRRRRVWRRPEVGAKA